MIKFNKHETGIEGLVVIEPTIYSDDRGFFMEAYNEDQFKLLGMDMRFVQDNHSKSTKGVLRGLHFQTKYPQGKLVRVIRGSVWDVAVDMRLDSNTFGQWRGIVLSETNRRMFYIPEGFAHGFVTLDNDTEFLYKCTNLYYAEYDAGILYNDEDLNIDWPFVQYAISKEELILSEKDINQPTWREYLSRLGQ